MKMLILEGPDNLGKSTTIERLKTMLAPYYKVHTMVHPNRQAWTEELEEYAMGSSTALPIERQYLIAANCFTQYARIPKDTEIVLCDRHPAVSNLVYFKDGSKAADMYRQMVQESTLNLADYLGIEYTCCIMLVGDRPFVAPNEAEHFEVTDKWQDVNKRYNRLKYTDALPNCGIEVCAVDAWNAKDQLADIVFGLFRYALKTGSLPQPLGAGIPILPGEGGSPSSEVYTPAARAEGHLD